MNVSNIVWHLAHFVAPESSSVSDLCRIHSQQYIDGITQKIPWAIRMYDATAKPDTGLRNGNVNSLGFFEECVQVKTNTNFSGHHCLATMILEKKVAEDPVEEMLKLRPMYWGLCVPSTCSNTDLSISLNEWMRNWQMKVLHVDCNDSVTRPMDATDWLAMAILIIIALLVLLSTGYDAYWLHRRRYFPRRGGRYSYFQKDNLLSSFSVLNNCHFLCKDAKSADLSSLYGIRFLSISWVVLGHVFLTLETAPAYNYLYVRELLGRWMLAPIISAPLAVDTFLMMSGLLLTHKFLTMMPKNVSFKKMSLATLLMIVHRYLRITPAFAMLILLQVSLLRHAGTGPLWLAGNDYLVDFCKQNWHWALLFVQNYVAGDRMCLPHSWYLNVDMQLFLMSPIVVIPLLYFRKWICFLMLACLIISGFVSSFLVNYLYELPAGLLVGDPGKWSAKSQYYYIVTHTRYAAFVIGIGVGYLLHICKEKPTKFQLTRKTQAIFWVVAAEALLYPIFGVLPFQSPNYKYEPITSSAFTAAAPIVWTTAVGYIVFSCETRQCPLLSRFLGMKSFQPLARLAYSIYLVHLPILTMRANVIRTPVYLCATEVVTQFFGCYTAAIIFAIFLYLGVEGPFMKFGYMISRWINERWTLDEDRLRTSTSLELTPTPPSSLVVHGNLNRTPRKLRTESEVDSSANSKETPR